MFKLIIKLIIVASIVAAIFFTQGHFSEFDSDDGEIVAMRESLISDPVVSIESLDEEQKQFFLDKFEQTKQDLITLNFDTLLGVNNVGQIKQSLGDFEGAITAFEFGNLIRPNNPLTFSSLASLYHYDVKDYAKAEKNYLISIVNNPSDVAVIRSLYELYFHELNDHKKAESLLKESIEENPEQADLYSLAGSFYRDTGDVEKAIEMFERHLELNPDSVSVREALEKIQAEGK